MLPSFRLPSFFLFSLLPTGRRGFAEQPPQSAGVAGQEHGQQPLHRSEIALRRELQSLFCSTMKKNCKKRNGFGNLFRWILVVAVAVAGGGQQRRPDGQVRTVGRLDRRRRRAGAQQQEEEKEEPARQPSAVASRLQRLRPVPKTIGTRRRTKVV